MISHTRLRPPHMAYATVLLTVFVIFTVLYHFVPMLLDELAFAEMYRSYNAGSDAFSLRALLDFAGEMREYDNSRLANVLSPLTTIVHPWCDIAPAVSALMVVVMIAGAVRLSGIRRHRAGLAVGVWAAVLLFLPWRNSILVADYTLNYVYAAAVNVVWLIAFAWWSGRRHGIWGVVGMVLLTVVAAMWHEGFSVTLLAGLGVDWLASGCRKPARWYLPAIIYLGATTYIVFCPGVLARAGEQMLNDVPYPGVKMLVELSLCILFALSALLMALFRSGRRMLAEAWGRPVFRVISAAMFAGVLLSIMVQHTARTTFWPSYCAIIALMILWRPVIVRLLRRRGARMAAGLLFVLLAVHGIYVITWQKKYYDEAGTIVAKLIASPSGTAFHDIIMPEELPDITLRIPTYNQWITGFNYICLDSYMHTKWLTVVPTALRDPYKDAVALDGGDGIMLTGGALWRQGADEFEYSDFNGAMPVDITLRDGTSLPGRHSHVARFVSAGGDTLLYIKPFNIDSRDVISAAIASGDD